jgi:hypothetical protein
VLKHIVFALLLAGPVFAQSYPAEQLLDEVRTIKCRGEIPKGFACAILFDDVSPPSLDSIDTVPVIGGMPDGTKIVSMVRAKNLVHNPPPLTREVSLILDGTLYTAVYDPPLKPDSKFPGLGRNTGVPARVDGDDLFIKWTDGKEVKAKIIRREKINPNRPQPA